MFDKICNWLHCSDSQCVRVCVGFNCPVHCCVVHILILNDSNRYQGSSPIQIEFFSHNNKRQEKIRRDNTWSYPPLILTLTTSNTKMAMVLVSYRRRHRPLPQQRQHNLGINWQKWNPCRASSFEKFWENIGEIYLLLILTAHKIFIFETSTSIVSSMWSNWRKQKDLKVNKFSCCGWLGLPCNSDH